MKILLVEDSRATAMVTTARLESFGHEVEHAISGQSALEHFQKTIFDLILMDINMPDMDGYTLTAKIKKMEKYKNIPIVAVTANVMRGDREKSLEAGCDGYIQKPIDIDTLALQVERFITRRTNA